MLAELSQTYFMKPVNFRQDLEKTAPCLLKLRFDCTRNRRLLSCLAVIDRCLIRQDFRTFFSNDLLE